MYLNALLASLNARSKFREVSYNNTETIVFGTLRSPVTSYPSRKAYMDGDGTHTFEVFPASNQSVLWCLTSLGLDYRYKIANNPRPELLKRWIASDAYFCAGPCILLVNSGQCDWLPLRIKSSTMVYLSPSGLSVTSSPGSLEWTKVTSTHQNIRYHWPGFFDHSNATLTLHCHVE